MIEVTCANGMIVCFEATFVITLSNGCTKLVSQLVVNDVFNYPPMGPHVVSATRSY